MESEFQEAFGGDEIYDGIAFTYKGGYAHSWNYGDYSNYDASTRPWYQQAQQADGQATIVAPYVTYLDPSYLTDDGYILMSIAQKYNDEISFDLDLKIKEISNLLAAREMPYAGEKIFLYDPQGYILTSTAQQDFAHNVYQPDSIVSEELSAALLATQKSPENLLIKKVDGEIKLVYIREDQQGNYICVLVPFIQVFIHEFFNILIITLLLILLEAFLYYWYLRNDREYMWRDMRLCRVADATYMERLYVDLKKMQFSGNDLARKNSKNSSYASLFELLKSRLVHPEDASELEAFLGEDAVREWKEETLTLLSKRFFMRMQDKETGTFKEKTIEISKMKFTCDGTPTMCIAMRDAAESVDLLKKALSDTKRLKEEKEAEYDRFMSYICMAEDGVEELDIQEHTITRYYLQDNRLQKHTVSYPGMPFDLFHEEDREEAYQRYNEDQLRIMCENAQSSYWECRMKWYENPEYRWCNVIVLGIPMSK